MSRIPFAQLKEEAERLVNRLVDESLAEVPYQEDKVESWCSNIPQSIIRNLHEFNKGFKFCATCVITRKNSSSLHINSTCLWNPSLDGFIVVKWENATMHCIINVFAIAL
ncbi:unnamed protein product [Blepharisma stoltei]|uniref:Dynein light chain n=1 Tax=Blepharisma stoltei TaxID=1481888 RepID=A0AAU9KE11_9CILI|nr:unnamed protein product [Blepharisma stoltei]